MVFLLSVTGDALLRLLELRRVVFGSVAVSTPPLAVPPSSWTRNVNEPYGVPFSLASAKNFRLPAVMSLEIGRASCREGVSISVSTASVDSGGIGTAASRLAGVELASL